MLLAILIGSYLLGSIPFAYLVSKWFKDIDIRTVGSRNPGAANVIIQVGKGPGAIVVILDMAKGFVPVILARSLDFPLWIAGLAGLFAIIDHCWPVFMRFDGGEGANTAIGAFLGFIPLVSFIALLGGFYGGFPLKIFAPQGLVWLPHQLRGSSRLFFPLSPSYLAQKAIYDYFSGDYFRRVIDLASDSGF